MSRPVLLISALAFISSTVLQAQAPTPAEQSAVYGDSGLRRQARVKGCSNDTTRSGPIKGQAIGLVVVDSSGHPLLSSLQIIQATRVSVNGARSLASRALVDCTFDVATGETRPVAAWAAFKVWTGRTGKAIVTRQHLPSPRPPAIAAATPRSIDLSAVYLDHDSLLEELPRQVYCGDSPGRAGFRKRELTEEEFFAGVHAGDGSAEVSYVVRPDGTVDESSLTIITTDNWNFARAYLARIANCDFAPGRIEGQPVAVKVVTRISRYARRAM